VGGSPDCYNSGSHGAMCVFAKRKMVVTDGQQYVQESTFKPDYWTYESIIKHLLYYWIEPYTGNGVNVKLSSSFHKEIKTCELSEEELTPFDFSLEDKNPLDALDAVVSSIPGRWIWWLSYSGNDIVIEISNIEEFAGKQTKQLSIGENDKLALNTNSVANLSVTRGVGNSSKYVIVRGGKMRLTTTVELQPVWGTGEPFTTETELKSWIGVVLKQKKAVEANKKLYDEAYVKYSIPVEGDFLKEAIQSIKQNQSTHLSGSLESTYEYLEDNLVDLFAKEVLLHREFDVPANIDYDSIVVFAYDELKCYGVNGVLHTPINGLDANRFIIYDSGDYSFDGETGVFKFKFPQYKRPSSKFLKNDVKAEEKLSEMIIPYSLEHFSGDSTNTVLYDKKLTSRKIFATLSILIDVPLITGDSNYDNNNFTTYSNFSKYIDLGDVNFDMQVNAFYPVLTGQTLFNSSKAYTIIDGIVETLNSKTITRCDNVKGYAKYANNCDETIIKKMKAIVEAMHLYSDSISVDVGYVNLLYKLGDMITSITNSEIEDEYKSGFYDLEDYIAEINISSTGDVNTAYNMTFVATNDVEYEPTKYSNDEDKSRPGVIDKEGKFKTESGLVES